jgi:hypothetical protein
MTPAERKQFAETHIEYEVRMLREQFAALNQLVQKRSRGRPPVGDPFLGADGQALLEAILVHLRLLDEFLGGRVPDRRGVYATAWVSAWSAAGFLGADRDRVDAKVAHLATRRDTLPVFNASDIAPLVEVCFVLLSSFLVDVGRTAESSHFDTVRVQVNAYDPGLPT